MKSKGGETTPTIKDFWWHVYVCCF